MDESIEPKDKKSLIQQIYEEFFSNIKKNKVFNTNDLKTIQELAETGDLKKFAKVKKFIAKFGSPSCGCGKVYDGTFSGKLIDGKGLTAQLLIDNGIKVFNDNEIDEFIKYTKQEV